MGVIRFSDGDVFNTDSQEYQILYNAVRQIKGVKGAVVEIGTRMGGSAKLIIDALEENKDTDRPMFCIDPYGNIDYPETNKALTVFSPHIEKEGDPDSTEIVNNIKHDYDNVMRNRVIPSLYYYAYSRGLNFTFFCLEDTEFFSRYYNGVPVYEEVKSLVNDYAFVFFDGPHTNDAVNTELAFFLSRAPKGCVYVFDDIWMYDHDKFEKQLFERGFELLEKGKIKASYKKGE
jgi:cephalosporin hydroxylase